MKQDELTSQVGNTHTHFLITISKPSGTCYNQVVPPETRSCVCVCVMLCVCVCKDVEFKTVWFYNRHALVVP